MRLSIYGLVTLVVANVALEDENVNATAPIEVKTSGEITNFDKKKTDKNRSTSSESGDHNTGESGDDSLGMSESGGSSTSESKKKVTKKPSYIPDSSAERRGWRKWHRKCKKCPVDMKKKWRDSTIIWICAGYQRARRSFKSKCMMEYRNCQDGTMFQKIKDGRCKNESSKEISFHGDHFFYEYHVKISDESSDTSKSSSSDSESESTVEVY